MQWIFEHGWGFASDFFDCARHSSDRGYFGKPKKVDYHALLQEEHIVITHSFGLHHLPPKAPIKRLVIIGGFCHIHTKGVKSRAYFAWLKNTLKNSPTQALQQFYQDCGVEKQAEENIDLPLLLADLEALNESVLDIAPLKQIEDVLIVHGTRDLIAPLEKGRELHQLLPGSRFMTYEGGHAEINCNNLINLLKCFHDSNIY